MRSLLRSAKAPLGKAGPRGTRYPRPAPLRADVGTPGAGSEMVGEPPSPRFVLWSLWAAPQRVRV